jgi:hypothetical protein
VTHEASDVDGYGTGIEGAEELPKGGRRAAVLSNDNRGDTLADGSERIGVLVETAIVMAVRVDEPGRKSQPACPDDGLARLRLKPANVDDAPASDPNGGAEARPAGAIEYRRALDDR